MNIQRHVIGVFAALMLALATALVPNAAAQAPGTGSGISVPIAGTGPGGTFTGALNIDRFVRSGQQILAVGTLSGTLTNTVTNVTSNVIRQVRIPLNLPATADLIGSTATCEILNLVLGPLDLDLLGLQIHLNQVVLVIQAEPGPGNLLGNLLCAVAGLLDPTGSLSGIVNLLNRILAILG